jgi:two-component system phosphate regulon sensor histidine kinase PhoR
LAINLKLDVLKNIGPKGLALLISSCFSVISLLFFLTIGAAGFRTTSAITLIILFVAISIAAYLMSFYLISYFLYRKIKLIYKIITDRKLGGDEGKEHLQLYNQDLNTVERDTFLWVKKKNQELDQMKEMERFRREYLGDVSHELKTPLFNIQAYLQTLVDDRSLPEEQQAEFLAKALKNATRLQEIINDLTIIHKIESGEKALLFQSFSIRDLIAEVFEEQQDIAAKKNVKLLFKEGADQDYPVNADREFIRIALSNLVNNSIKYGKYNGFVKVSCYLMEESVLVEVSDNGIGIGEEHLPHVFERFYRADKSRSREQGGSGLGLSIVKHIMEGHHQTLHVRSKEGVGSTFGFTLRKA